MKRIRKVASDAANVGRQRQPEPMPSIPIRTRAGEQSSKHATSKFHEEHAAPAGSSPSNTTHQFTELDLIQEQRISLHHLESLDCPKRQSAPAAESATRAARPSPRVQTKSSDHVPRPMDSARAQNYVTSQDPDQTQIGRELGYLMESWAYLSGDIRTAILSVVAASV